MSLFWFAFWGSLAGMAVLTLAVIALMPWLDRVLLNTLSDRLMKSLVSTKYTMNLASFITLARRANPQVFLENMLRADQDTAISRPMGSPLVFSHWEKLVFNPAQLKRLPTAEATHVNTKVVIGPRCEKPLHLDIPIVITGMSYGGALSAKTKVALALGANQAGTATNTGENYLPDEREAADKLIVQYHRGTWPRSAQNHPAWLDNADAIEIQIGQGAQAAAEMRTRADRMSAVMRDTMGLEPGEDAVIRPRLEGVDSAEVFVSLVLRLKKRYAVPVGVKLAPSGWLRDDLQILMQAEPDFITLDGGEGGTHGGPPILQDDFGLPLMAAIHWTHDYLKTAGLRHRTSIIAAGGLRTPGDFLKAIAIGADAVYIGFAALMAMASSQSPKVLPWAPPEAIFYEQGASKHLLDVAEASKSLANFLLSSTDELKFGIVALGRSSISEVNQEDLIALDPWTARMAGVASIIGPNPSVPTMAEEMTRSTRETEQHLGPH